MWVYQNKSFFQQQQPQASNTIVQSGQNQEGSSGAEVDSDSLQQTIQEIADEDNNKNQANGSSTLFSGDVSDDSNTDEEAQVIDAVRTSDNNNNGNDGNNGNSDNNGNDGQEGAIAGKTTTVIARAPLTPASTNLLTSNTPVFKTVAAVPHLRQGTKRTSIVFILWSQVSHHI